MGRQEGQRLAGLCPRMRLSARDPHACEAWRTLDQPGKSGYISPSRTTSCSAAEFAADLFFTPAPGTVV